jgi:hypothetical protein
MPRDRLLELRTAGFLSDTRPRADGWAWTIPVALIPICGDGDGYQAAYVRTGYY